MKVLIIYGQPLFWSMGEGSGAAIFSALPSAMAARGHEVRVSLPAPAGTDAHASFPEEQYRGFLLEREPSPRGFLPNANLPTAARLRARFSCWMAYQKWAIGAARRAAARHRPDLVLAMGHYEAPVARRLARELHVPNATRLFGNSLSLSLGDPFRFYANFPEVIAFRTKTDLLVLNDDGADGDAVARRFRLRPGRFVHMRNGVDFDLFQPGPPSPAIRARLGLGPRQPLLITVTRLASEKKLTRAIDVLGDLRRHRPDAVLAILGDGPERARLEQYARDLIESEAVRFPGPIPQRELPDWYRSATMLLSLLDRTNAANPVFEAMACGIPVAALDAGTTSRVVVDGETGIVAPRERLALIGDTIAGLLADPPRLARMGEAAHRAIPGLVMHLPDRLAFEVGLYERAAEGKIPLPVPLGLPGLAGPDPVAGPTQAGSRELGGVDLLREEPGLPPVRAELGMPAGKRTG